MGLKGKRVWRRRFLGYWTDRAFAVSARRSGRFRLMRRVLAIVALEAGALWIIAAVLPGLSLGSPAVAVLAVATISVLNAFLRPLLLSHTLPLTVFSFGLVAIAINAGILMLAARLLPGFVIRGFASAFIATIALGIINLVTSAVFEISDDDSFYREVVRRSARRRFREQSTSPGIAIIQIDGLAANTLRLAIRTGIMPTLARWVREGTHRLTEWECGLPSQTSASQAGIMYGSNYDIPGFRWYEKDTGRFIVSNHPQDAASISKRISDGKGLLSNVGSSVSNLFSGDATRSILTMSTLMDSHHMAAGSFYSYFLSPYSVTRTGILMAREMLLELWQARQQYRRGVLPRIGRGWSFALLRAVSNVALKDLSLAVLYEEIHSGVPVIYVGFSGYDELAHHAGPERPESLSVLADLDNHLASVERVAMLTLRPYKFVILSDHGQTQGAPFRQRYGVTLEEFVKSFQPGQDAIRSNGVTEEAWGHFNAVINELMNSTGRFGGRAARAVLRSRMNDGLVDVGPDRAEARSRPGSEMVISASGNLAHIYFVKESQRLTKEHLDVEFPNLLDGLVSHPGIAFLLVRSATHGPLVIGESGTHYLFTQKIKGRDPLEPFGPYAVEHLKHLDGFPHTGDIVVNSMYDSELQEAAPFEELVGSHGGLGGSQNGPFLLYPSDWELPVGDMVGSPAIFRFLREHLQRD